MCKDKPIVVFNDKYSFQRYEYGWILIRTYESDKIDKKTGELKVIQKKSYYATLARVLSTIIDEVSGDCKTLDEIREYLEYTNDNLESIIRKLDIY